MIPLKIDEMWGIDVITTARHRKEGRRRSGLRPLKARLRGFARCHTRSADRSVAAGPPRSAKTFFDPSARSSVKNRFFAVLRSRLKKVTKEPSDSSVDIKENLLWLRKPVRVSGMRRDRRRFKDEYNERWSVEPHGHRSPSVRLAIGEHATRWMEFRSSHRLIGVSRSSRCAVGALRCFKRHC